MSVIGSAMFHGRLPIFFFSVAETETNEIIIIIIMSCSSSSDSSTKDIHSLSDIKFILINAVLYPHILKIYSRMT
jgi:hypothetical protein